MPTHHLSLTSQVFQTNPCFAYPNSRLHLLLQNIGSGSALLNVSQQLIDGHWVLSFASPKQAQYAQEMVEHHSARLRILYGEALLPMLTSSQTL